MRDEKERVTSRDAALARAPRETARPVTPAAALAAVGFGLVLALNAFTLWGVSDLLNPESAWPWAAADMRSFCLPANVLSFLAYGLLATRLPALSQRRPVLPACALLLLGGITLLVACVEAAHGVPLFQVAGALLGVGGALAFVCWEFSFARLGETGARVAILAASVFSTIPYLLLAFLAHDVVVYPLSLALVPACVVALAVSTLPAFAGRTRGVPGSPDSPEGGVAFASPGRAAQGAAPDSLAHAAQALPRHPRAGQVIPATAGPSAAHESPRGGAPEVGADDPSPWRALWADAWLPLVCTMMIGVIGPAVGAFASLGGMGDALRITLYQIANVAAVATLAIGWFCLGRRPSIPGSFLVLVPVLALALFLFPFWSSAYQAFFLALGCFVFSYVSILMMMACIELSNRHRVGLGVTYGFFAAATYLAQVLGGSLAGIVGASDYPRQFQLIAIVALMLWDISAVAVVVMRRGRAAALGEPAAADEGLLAGQPPSAGNSFPACQKTPAEGGSPSPWQTTPAAGSSPAQAPSPQNADPTGGRAQDPLTARCEALRECFGLTSREVEVLALIGRGRDVGAIAEILCLSRNTVRSHVQRLYADLGVHNRQECIDLLEADD